MLATLAALWLSASDGAAIRDALPQVVLTKRKAKKKAAPKSAPKLKEKEPIKETSEGLDLTAPAPAPAPEPAPAPVEAAPPEVAPGDASTAEGEGPDFSLVTPETVGEGRSVLEAGVGWPGVYAGYWRGLLANLDVGGKVGFNWAYEGLLTRPTLGLRFQVMGRYQVWDNGSLSLGVSFAPGALVYFVPVTGARGGLLLPVQATLGLPELLKNLNLSVSLELPFWVLFGVGAVLPIVAGANAEYFLSEQLVVFLKLKPLGIALWLNGAPVNYTFEALLGVGFKL